MTSANLIICILLTVRRSFEQSRVAVAPDVDDQIWPPHCIQHEEGAEFVEGLDVHSEDAIINKVGKERTAAHSC